MSVRTVPSFRRAVDGAPRVHYRADIDGLRGIAVLSVVAFHAAPSVLRGGFVGVDVFFVLSGFLITAILLKDVASDRGVLASFYARRVKRIFPALALVLAGTSVIAWFILLAGEHATFGKHLIGGATFSSNFVLQGEAGYFDVTADRKPLLHLWSLAVEEQFYLLFPLALVLARRRRLDVGVLVAAIAIASFATGLAAPGSAFYSPVARFWELMIGALLAQRGAAKRFPFAETPRPLRERTLLATFGCLLVGASMYVLTAKQPLPSGWALAPTVGTAAIISAGQDAWPNQRLLSLPLLTWFGRISFPLYLWHWPLLSLLRIAASAPPPSTARLVAVGLSVVLAWLTHVAIERPLRASRRVKLATTVLCAALALAGLYGAALVGTGGFPRRAVVALNPFQAPQRESDFDPRTRPGCLVPADQERRFDACRTDTRERPTVAIIGDSKARALFNGFVRESDAGTRVLIISGGGARGIVPVLSDAPGYRHYSELATIASDAVLSEPAIRVVVLVAATRLLFGLEHDDTLEELPGSANAGIAFEGLDRMITKLTSAGKAVVMIVDNPTLPDPADCVSRVTSLPFLNDALALRKRRSDCTITYARQLELSKPYRDVLFALKAKHERLQLFDTLDVLCEEKRVCSAADREGKVLYSYGDHVSELGASLVARALWPMLRDAARPTGP
jgi:peptidoglycan/LPS O-acetylase OafA/YrhL